MSGVTLKPKDLTAYLLGKARADEEERFDELSITDNEFAEALEAAETDLIDSYANGELSAADRKEFERRYIRSADQNNRVVFANVLQEYAAARLSAIPVASTGGGLFGRTRIFQFGLAAAALLLAIVGGWFFISRSAQKINETAAVQNNNANPAIPPNNVGNSQIELPSKPINDAQNTHIELPSNDARENAKEKTKETPKDERPPAPRIVAVVLTPQLRSSGTLRKVEVPLGTDQFSAQLELESGDFRSYRAVLREQSSNRVVWQSKTVKPTGPVDARRLALSIPARLLNSTIYTFTVSGLSDTGTAEIVGDYSFTVVR